MNRKQRRATNREKNRSVSKSNTFVTGLTLSSVLTTTIGLSGPALADNTINSGTNIDSCATFNSELTNIGNNGGTYNLTFTGTCVTQGSLPISSSNPLTLNGPSSGGLTIDIGPTAYEFASTNTTDLTVNGIDFTVSDGHTIGSLFWANSTIPTFNFNQVSIHDIASVNMGAIYVEGHVNVSDSSFANLNSSYNATALNLPPGYTQEVTISNSTFINNGSTGSSELGVIDFSGSGNMTISRSVFQNNSNSYFGSGNGGAISQRGINTISIEDSTFTSNVAGSVGGAISSTGGTLNIDSTTFNSNSSQSNGGAIYSEGSVNVVNSTFFSNSASNGVGGAIATPNSQVDINNATFVDNTAADGGALFSEGGIVSNSTFWNNPVNSNASSASAASLYFSGGSLFANILANSNATPVVGSSTTDLGANLCTDATFVKTTTGIGASKLVTLASLKLEAIALNTTLPTNSGATKTVALREGSSARNYYAANSAGISPSYNGVSRLASHDQRGVARPMDGNYDVGAYEGGAVNAPPSPSPSPKPTTQATHKTILFRGDSAKLTTHAKAQLRALAQTMRTNGQHTITLDGHTATLTKADPSGRKLRGRIAAARTRAVEKYLKKQFKQTGYSVTITRVIKGAADPVKSNRTEKGRKANRRVYITIQ